jgi:hypothetical protein
MDPLSGKTERNVRPLVVLSLATLVFSLPVILYGFPTLGHDGRVHLLWHRQFSSQFWAGEWYPRWLMGSHRGFGSPTFFFYGPFPFFVTSLLAPLGRLFTGLPRGYVEMGVAAVIALWGSGMAMYLWLRRSCGAAAATVGALVYLANPYHLTVDLYMRAAFAEYWAFVWMPLILYFTEGVVRRRRYSVMGLAVSYALLVTTHLITTVIFSPLPIAYALFLSNRRAWLRDLARLSGGFLLGIGLAAIYWLPALDHQRYVSAQRYLQDPVFQWQNNFPPLDKRLFERSGTPWPTFVQFIAILTLLAGLAVACLVSRAGTFWVGVAGASFFMMTPLSAPVWRLLPVLANLQFPWRYQTLAGVAISALAALSFGKRRSVWVKAGMVVIALLWLGFFGRMFYVFSKQDHQVGWNTTFTEDPFLSAWASAGAQAVPMELVRVEHGYGEAEIVGWAPRDIRVRVNCQTDCRLEFHQFYYPGWRADGFGVDASGRGLIRVAAPPGKHEFRLRLDGDGMERTGRWVSVICALGVLVVAFVDLRRSTLDKNTGFTGQL